MEEIKEFLKDFEKVTGLKCSFICESFHDVWDSEERFVNCYSFKVREEWTDYETFFINLKFDKSITLNEIIKMLLDATDLRLVDKTYPENRYMKKKSIHSENIRNYLLEKTGVTTKN